MAIPRSLLLFANVCSIRASVGVIKNEKFDFEIDESWAKNQEKKDNFSTMSFTGKDVFVKIHKCYDHFQQKREIEGNFDKVRTEAELMPGGGREKAALNDLDNGFVVCPQNYYCDPYPRLGGQWKCTKHNPDLNKAQYVIGELNKKEHQFFRAPSKEILEFLGGDKHFPKERAFWCEKSSYSNRILCELYPEGKSLITWRQGDWY